MIEAIQVEPRTSLGSRNSIRLRKSGKLPATLYGHKEPAVNLQINADQLGLVMRHNTRVVELQGAASGQALLQQLQWDTFGRYVLHVDLLRVDASERVSVEVPVETKGDAPGEAAGGTLEMVLHTIEIEVSPLAIPDRLHVNVSQLEVGGSLHVSDIYDLPEGATLVTEADQVVVNCVKRAAMDEEESAGPAPAEPELVGRKKADEEEDKD